MMPRAMGSSAPDPGLIPDEALKARFAASLDGLWPDRAGGRLGLAVSGGPDSLALLLLAAAVLSGNVEAATVDHRLRPEGAQEARDVAQLCARLGVPHRILAVEVAPGNLQTEARRARYGALAGWLSERGLAALATAHHADDQAETLLLRLNRASGVAGLAGVRPRGVVPGSDWPVLRPLLGWRRAELGGLVENAGIVAAQDPSNVDDRFDRARLRKAIAAADWLDIAAVAQSALHLSDADAAIEWAARREWRECVKREALGYLYRPQAPRAVALRVIGWIVAEIDGAAPRGGAVARAFDALLAREAVSIGNVVARPAPAGWSFTRAPRRRERQDATD